MTYEVHIPAKKRPLDISRLGEPATEAERQRLLKIARGYERASRVYRKAAGPLPVADRFTFD